MNVIAYNRLEPVEEDVLSTCAGTFDLFIGPRHRHHVSLIVRGCDIAYDRSSLWDGRSCPLVSSFFIRAIAYRSVERITSESSVCARARVFAARTVHLCTRARARVCTRPCDYIARFNRPKRKG